MNIIKTTHLLSNNGKEFDTGSSRQKDMDLRVLTREEAVKLFDAGKRVYFIYQNNRIYKTNVRKVCKDLDYLKAHYDFYLEVCGVPAKKTERSEAHVKSCNTCGCELEWSDSHEPSLVLSSSDNYQGFLVCRSCMTEHCNATNCLGCEYLLSENPDAQSYKQCRFYYLKNTK